MNGRGLRAVLIEQAEGISRLSVRVLKLGQAGVGKAAAAASRNILGIRIQPGHLMGVRVDGANADSAGGALEAGIGGQNQVFIDRVVRRDQDALHIDEGHHTAIAGVLAVELHIPGVGAPGLAAVGAVGIAQVVDGIPGVHAQAAVGQADNLGLAGLAGAVQAIGAAAPGPGLAAVVGVGHTGQLVASLVVVQGEDDALFAVHHCNGAPAGTHAQEGLILTELDIQILGFAPLQAAVRDLGAAHHNEESGVGLPLGLAVEQIVLHRLIAAALGAQDRLHAALPAVVVVEIQESVHPVAGLRVVCGGTDGVQGGSLAAHLIDGPLRVQVHIIDVGRKVGGGVRIGLAMGHQHPALAVKAAAGGASPVAAHQAHIGGRGVHGHPDRAVPALNEGGVDKGRAGLAGRGNGLICVVVDDLPLPGFAAVSGDADDGVQVLGVVGGGPPADIGGGQNPAVVQGQQGGNAEIAASSVLLHQGLAVADAREVGLGHRRLSLSHFVEVNGIGCRAAAPLVVPAEIQLSPAGCPGDGVAAIFQGIDIKHGGSAAHGQVVVPGRAVVQIWAGQALEGIAALHSFDLPQMGERTAHADLIGQNAVDVITLHDLALVGDRIGGLTVHHPGAGGVFFYRRAHNGIDAVLDFTGRLGIDVDRQVVGRGGFFGGFRLLGRSLLVELNGIGVRACTPLFLSSGSAAADIERLAAFAGPADGIGVPIRRNLEDCGVFRNGKVVVLPGCAIAQVLPAAAHALNGAAILALQNQPDMAIGVAVHGQLAAADGDASSALIGGRLVGCAVHGVSVCANGIVAALQRTGNLPILTLSLLRPVGNHRGLGLWFWLHRHAGLLEKAEQGRLSTGVDVALSLSADIFSIVRKAKSVFVADGVGVLFLRSEQEDHRSIRCIDVLSGGTA